MKKKQSTKKSTAGKKTAQKKTATKKSAAKKTASIRKSPLTFLTESLPGFTVGRRKKTSIKAVGGTKPYSFGLSQNSTLPAGLSLNSKGTLWGTPTQSGDTTIFVEVIDFVGAHVTQAFDLQIEDA